MPKDFKYDVTLLISCIKDRPCLWDKSLENYKDRVERRNAWVEIFNILDDGYEQLLPEERRATEELIVNKWTNIRDTFMKTLKTKMGKPKKKYLLYDQLKFLIKDENDDDQYSIQEISDISNSYFKQEEIEKESERESKVSRKRSKRRVYSSEEYEPPIKFVNEYTARSSDVNVEETYESSDSRLMNEDEAFFASLLPTVVRYSEDERLEFRIEVLALMRRIKENRRQTSAD